VLNNKRVLKKIKYVCDDLLIWCCLFSVIVVSKLTVSLFCLGSFGRATESLTVFFACIFLHLYSLLVYCSIVVVVDVLVGSQVMTTKCWCVTPVIKVIILSALSQ